MSSRFSVDPERPNWSGSGPRPLSVVLWYPAPERTPPSPVWIGPEGAPIFRAGEAIREATPASGPFPLIVLSHGTGGSALQLMWLGRRLAAQGFVVAALNHHGNTAAEERMTAQGSRLFWERPREVSVLLDRMAADETWAPRIDFERVGAGGFSLGGYTVLALAGARMNLAAFARFCGSEESDATCDPQAEYPEVEREFEKVRESEAVQASMRRSHLSYRDPRIKPSLRRRRSSEAMSASGVEAIEVPVSIVVGSADDIAPSATNANRYARLIGAKASLSVEPLVTHSTFLSACTPEWRSRLSVCRDPQGVDRNGVHRGTAAGAARFFEEYLRAR